MKNIHLALAAGIMGLAATATAGVATPLGTASLEALGAGDKPFLLVRDGDEEAGLNRERSSSNERWRFSDYYYPRYRGDRVYGYSYGPTVEFGLGTRAYPPYRYRYYDYPYRNRYAPSFGLYVNP
jgi:hypothetical protein